MSTEMKAIVIGSLIGGTIGAIASVALFTAMFWGNASGLLL